MKNMNCVDMKRQIQRELAKDYDGMSEASARDAQEIRIKKNKYLSKFLKAKKPCHSNRVLAGC